MKKFEELLGMTQEQLKEYLGNYLRGVGYRPNTADGFIFAKGELPVLLIAHMDTARKEIPKTIIKEPTIDGIRIVAENSIVGGDDRCGCWMIMNIIKKAKCHVLFVEDEEIGCVGARKFTKEDDYVNYVKNNISFMIELDRRGSNDCVFYSNDNRDFVKYIEEKTGTKEAIGSMSDISTIMPATKVAGVNLSCGYYKEHTRDEYISVVEMNDMIARLTEFLTGEEEFPAYEYVPKKWSYSGYGSYGSGYGYGYGYGDYGSSYSYGSSYKSRLTGPQQEALDTLKELTLVVTLDPEWSDGLECDEEIVSFGKNQAECWAKLFIENEDLCFSMISKYRFE